MDREKIWEPLFWKGICIHFCIQTFSRFLFRLIGTGQFVHYYLHTVCSSAGFFLLFNRILFDDDDSRIVRTSSDFDFNKSLFLSDLVNMSYKSEQISFKKVLVCRLKNSCIWNKFKAIFYGMICSYYEAIWYFFSLVIILACEWNSRLLCCFDSKLFHESLSKLQLPFSVKAVV